MEQTKPTKGETTMTTTKTYRDSEQLKAIKAELRLVADDLDNAKKNRKAAGAKWDGLIAELRDRQHRLNAKFMVCVKQEAR
jgi:hypothetical protein